MEYLQPRALNFSLSISHYILLIRTLFSPKLTPDPSPAMLSRGIKTHLHMNQTRNHIRAQVLSRTWLNGNTQQYYIRIYPFRSYNRILITYIKKYNSKSKPIKSRPISPSGLPVWPCNTRRSDRHHLPGLTGLKLTSTTVHHLLNQSSSKPLRQSSPNIKTTYLKYQLFITNL